MVIYQHQGEKVYFDSCCISRKYDDLTYANVKAEAEKIQEIIDNQALGGYSIVGSAIIVSEIGRIRDDKKREGIERYYENNITDEVGLFAQDYIRAHELHLKGLGKMDSRHLAAAEAASADYLLTTDAAFIKKCARQKLTAVKVINPLDF